jgi:hypothetical protein
MFVLCLTSLLIADVCHKGQTSATKGVFRQRTVICYQKSIQDKHLLPKEKSDKGQTSATKRVVRERTNICYQKSRQTKDTHLLPKEMSDKGQTSATLTTLLVADVFLCLTTLLVADVCPLSDISFDSRCLSFL